jgi:hypothetical protein
VHSDSYRIVLKQLAESFLGASCLFFPILDADIFASTKPMTGYQITGEKCKHA